MKNKILSFGLMLFFTTQLLAQKANNSWNEIEKRNYRTLNGLAEYVNKKDSLQISRNTLFNKYIYFDNVLNDTILERKAQKINAFDGLFKSIPKTIDSLGLKNLDAKPIRFYKDHEIFKPFEKSLSGIEKDVFVYFLKTKPNEPLGYLLFESNSGKLASWVLLKQGHNSWFFLTFNIL